MQNTGSKWIDLDNIYISDQFFFHWKLVINDLELDFFFIVGRQQGSNCWTALKYYF